MDNKNLLRAAGILVVIVLVLSLATSIFSNSTFPSTETQPTGPRVIAQDPVEGQRLDLSPTIEITFDRDMDPLKTGDSFSLLSNGTAVPVRTTWIDARTFSFTPDSPLSPNTEYVAAFSTQAEASDGTSPSEEIKIEFTTIESLAVMQVFPAQDTQEVDLASSITVIFNHPVVPLSIVEEQSKLLQPLKFTPEVKGQGEWVNSSVYVFQPEEILLSGTSYQVKIEAGVTDTLGNTLDKSYLWQFATRSPSILNFALKDGAENPTEEVKNVPLDQAFIVTFQQPMIQESAEAAVKIVNRETAESVPVSFKWDETFSTLSIEPKEKFSIASYYELTISTDAQAADGGHLYDGLAVQFATVPLPTITGVFPAAGSKNTGFYSTISFASPMDFESIK
jgi:hypothetical protein